MFQNDEALIQQPVTNGSLLQHSSNASHTFLICKPNGCLHMLVYCRDMVLCKCHLVYTSLQALYSLCVSCMLGCKHSQNIPPLFCNLDLT